MARRQRFLSFRGIATGWQPVVTRPPNRQGIVVKTYAIVLSAIFILSGTVKAQQVPVKLWVEAYDGVSHRTLGMVTPILDRHGVLWGTATYQNAAGVRKVAPMSFSSSGAMTLFEVYDSASAGTIERTAMALDDTQAVYVTGAYYPLNAQAEGILLRYLPSGLIDWTLHFPIHAGVCRIALDSAGNIFLAISDDRAIQLWKVAQNGVVVDSTLFREDTVNLDLGSLVIVDSGDVFLACTRSWSYYEPPGMPILFSQPQVMKVDSHCRLLWEKHAGVPAMGGARRDRQGNLVGFSSGTVAKVSPDGQLLWETSVGNEMQLTSMAIDSRSRVIACGYGTGEWPYPAIVCYDSDGNIQWADSLSNAGPARVHYSSIALDSADNIYVTGDESDGSPGVFWPTVKFDPGGKKVWETRFTRTTDGYDGGTYVAVDSKGDVYSVGSCFGPFANDLIVIKYAQVVSTVGPASVSGVPTRFVLQQNYPNPFNPTTVISGQWAVDSKVRLVVYDVLGREVAVLADGRFLAGRYVFEFDGTNLTSGVYFYRLTAGNFTAVRKMNLLK